MTVEEKENKIKCKPFLRWAGGKTWLIKDLGQFLPEGRIETYHEPFLGGGAVFFHLNPTNKALLSDLNPELIHTYNVVRDDVERVISELSKFENTKEFYYQIRAKKFKKAEKQAAQFIYLNQTSFNGIYRVNLKGEYNVPYGHRKKNFLEPENLRLVSKRLQNAKIFVSDFSVCIYNINPGDLVFLDPPYTISHNNNGFFKYNKNLFSEDDQLRLSEFIDNLREIGANYVLTNAAHVRIKEIFSKGDRIVELKRASLVGGANAKRGNYSEMIFTNITN